MRDAPSDFYVVVSGPPGSGKSTLASRLAPSLGLPLFAKDTIKEALYESLGAGSLEESHRVSGAAFAALVAMARENRRGVVEGAWTPSLARDELRALPSPVVEVFCAIDPEVARARYRARGSTRHAGHFDEFHGARMDLWTGERIEPVAGGWPVLHVDTTRPVALALVRERIRDAIGRE